SGWISPVRAVEHVGDFHPDTQTHAFLQPEGPSQVHVFHRTPLASIIAVISGRRTELADGRVFPRIGIQDKCLVGIVAMAVEIHCERVYSRFAVRETCSLEQIVIEVALRIRNLQWETARILQEGS